MCQLERKTLYFGGRNQAGDLFACGVPGPATDGGAITFDADKAALVTAGFWPTSTAQESYRKIDLVPRGADPISAICIAPDSAIHTCDIALVGLDGELERHRVSPGNPLVGIPAGAGFALVSIPNSIPLFTDTGAGVLHWDSAKMVDGSGGHVVGFPLRLEVWHGNLPPMRGPYRAGYFAHMLFAIASGASRSLRVCVDGRSRVDVVTNSSAGTSTISMQASEALKRTFTADTGAQRRDTWASFTLPVTDAGGTSYTTTPNIVSFNGNPMTALVINIAQTVADAIVQVKVKAWD
jgi:hypothetical protein